MKRLYPSHIRYRKLLLLPSISCLILAILLTLVLGYLGLRQTLFEHIVSAQELLIQQTSTKIETLLSNVRIVSNIYYYDATIDTIINSNAKYFDEATLYDFYVSLKYIDEQMKSALINANMPYHCVILSDAGYAYSSAARKSDYDFSQYYTETWDRSLRDTTGRIVMVTPYFDNSKSWCWSFARLLKTTTNKPAGRLFINIDESTIRQLYQDIAEGNQVFILSDSDVIVSSNDASLINKSYKTLFSGEYQGEAMQHEASASYLAVSSPIEDSNLSIVKHISLYEAFSPLFATTARILTYCIAIMGALVVILLAITSKAFLPFEQLCDSLSQVANGDLDVSFSSSRIKEFQQINATCNTMVSEIKHLLKDVKHTEARKRIAEIQALQAQIRPHFLYNTLFSIKCMVDMNKRETASDMLKHLCVLLQSLQHNQEVLIQITDEIDELKQYVHLMGCRYPDSFTVSYDIEQGVEQYKILRHILQPLVENAIFHGMRADGEVNRIQISIRQTADLSRLIITVSDTGAGMTPDTAARLFSPRNVDSDSNHLGLYNINERLCLYFHIPGPITVDSVPNEKTSFEIVHPVIVSEVDRHDEDPDRG